MTKREIVIVLAISLLSNGSSALSAAASHPAVAGSPVVIANARQIDFTSKVNGRSYRLFIAQPLFPPPTAGYPVLYVLDGNEYFGTAVETSRSQYYSSRISGVVVVGIGYPTQDPREIEKLRVRDLTLPVQLDPLRQKLGMVAADIGGVDAFLSVIEQEIKPRVSAIAPVDPANTALFGHSFGGQTVLHALFKHGGMFRTFIAASPGIHWGDEAVLADEPDFTRQVEVGIIAPRILIEVGAEESDVYTQLPAPSPAAPPGWHATFSLEEINAAICKAHSVQQTRELAHRLEKIKGNPSYHVAGIVFPNESHVSVVPASISRAVGFAFGTD